MDSQTQDSRPSLDHHSVCVCVCVCANQLLSVHISSVVGLDSECSLLLPPGQLRVHSARVCVCVCVCVCEREL